MALADEAEYGVLLNGTPIFVSGNPEQARIGQLPSIKRRGIVTLEDATRVSTSQSFSLSPLYSLWGSCVLVGRDACSPITPILCYLGLSPQQTTI